MTPNRFNHIVEVASMSLSRRYEMPIDEAREFIYDSMPNILKKLNTGLIKSEKAMYRYVYVAGRNNKFSKYRKRKRSIVIFNSEVVSNNMIASEGNQLTSMIKREEEIERRMLVKEAVQMLPKKYNLIMRYLLENPEIKGEFAGKELGYDNYPSYRTRKAEAFKLVRKNIKNIKEGKIEKKSSHQKLAKSKTEKENWKTNMKFYLQSEPSNEPMGTRRFQSMISLIYLTSLTQNSMN